MKQETIRFNLRSNSLQKCTLHYWIRNMYTVTEQSDSKANCLYLYEIWSSYSSVWWIFKSSEMSRYVEL